VFDPNTKLSPACLPIVVEWNAQRPRWRQAPSEAARIAQSIRYRFEVTDVPGYRTDVVLTDAQSYMEAVSNAPVDVTFRCDGETFILLMYGRIRAQEVVSQGRMTFEGDTALVAAFNQGFQGG
jgi:predicted lipid carrier protein YhbT